MRRHSYYLAGILILAIVYAATSQSIPVAYYGAINREGVEAPIGTEISVWIDGNEIVYSNYTTGAKGIYGPNPYLIVLPDNTDTPEKDGGVNGDTIVFKINGFTADQTATWNPGNIDEVDLTCTNCDNSPSLNGSVSPSIGYTDTPFTFAVTYTDQDNDAPSFLKLDVSGNLYDITGNFSDATAEREYKDGKEHSNNISGLSPGIHTYKFSGSDDFIATSSAIMDGPIVLDRSYVSLTQGWNLISLPLNPYSI